MRYPDDDIPFHSRVESAALDHPLVVMPSGIQVTAFPLADQDAPALGNGALMRASYDRDEGIAALAMFGLVLLDLKALREMASVGLWTPPVTLVADAYDQNHMQSLGYKREHDRRAWAHLGARKGIYPGMILTAPVLNFGKTHIAGAAPGANRMGGWDKTDNGKPDFIQQGVGDNHVGARQWDYGTNTYGMVQR